MPSHVEPLLFPVVAAVLALVVLGFVVRGWITSWQRRRRFSRARDVEAVAPRILLASGYEVVGAQVPGSYSIRVNGQPFEVALRADYIVMRQGRRFVAEVKSGKLAPRLGTAATRRQLLEYSLAFPVDGALLVDGEKGRIYAIEFPRLRDTPKRRNTAGLAIAMAVAVIVLILVFAFAQRGNRGVKISRLRDYSFRQSAGQLQSVSPLAQTPSPQRAQIP